MWEVKLLVLRSTLPAFPGRRHLRVRARLLEDALHGVGKDSKRRTGVVKGHNDCVLRGARVLVFVANDHRVSSCEGSSDHAATCHEADNLIAQVLVADVAALTN